MNEFEWVEASTDVKQWLHCGKLTNLIHEKIRPYY